MKSRTYLDPDVEWVIIAAAESLGAVYPQAEARALVEKPGLSRIYRGR